MKPTVIGSTNIHRAWSLLSRENKTGHAFIWIEIISKLSLNTPTNQIINLWATFFFKSTKLDSKISNALTLHSMLFWPISNWMNSHIYEADAISIPYIELFIWKNKSDFILTNTMLWRPCDDEIQIKLVC